jgi:hypothetical protein
MSMLWDDRGGLLLSASRLIEAPSGDSMSLAAVAVGCDAIVCACLRCGVTARLAGWVGTYWRGDRREGEAIR